ncbi:hypothetical protein [Mesorhizobium sp. INR15]|uniref:hypothetical protein n=1 Tax=Mesorhizobium sp. INR15 TaxID=2654248 RepID=UPI0018964BF5|nr:hypothetical protein [Mesorhizobium sp. INR15]
MAGAAAGAAQLPLIFMSVSAVLLDIGVSGDQTLGRRAAKLLRPKARGRINGQFFGIFFFGGAIGWLPAGIAWPGVAECGMWGRGRVRVYRAGGRPCGWPGVAAARLYAFLGSATHCGIERVAAISLPRTPEGRRKFCQ